MPVWKQILVLAVLVVAAVAGWGALDPAARQTLIGYGVPEPLVPAWAFLATADGDAAGQGPGNRGADAAGPGQRSGQGGAGQAGAGGPRGAGAGGGQGGGGRGPQGPVPVVTAATGTATTNDRVSAIGTGEADRTVTVFPRTTGMITDLSFQPGQAVVAGDVLVRLDSEAESIALQRAEVTLADARAKVERYEQLAANRAISSVERDTARSELTSAELAVREARLDLERRLIRAPFAGVVGLTDVEVGGMVSAQTAIVTIDDRSTLKVEFRIPESYASLVALGHAVTATTPSRPGETFEGQVSALGSRVEADSRTLVVQARLDNARDELRPGMSFLVSLRFPGDVRPSVPALSLQWDRDGSYVWRVVDGKVERVAVAIVERNSDVVLVEGPLAAGDVVVVEGVQQLRPGATVALADAPVTPAGAVSPDADAARPARRS